MEYELVPMSSTAMGSAHRVNQALCLSRYEASTSTAVCLSNAVPEWQARSAWWHNREPVVACPLKGHVIQLA
jgi:hypothetical protein